MFDGALLTAFALALSAGIATFFSPCAYPLLPGYVGYYVSQTDGEETSLEGALARGLVAGTGSIATIAGISVAAFWIGREALSSVTVLEPIVGLVLVVFGVLIALGWKPSLSIALPRRRSGVLGFGVFGAGYALAAVGCVAPIFLGVIAYALGASTGVAGLVLGTYTLTIALLMVSVTVATGMGLLAGGSRLRPYTGHLIRIAGVVMIVAGLGQLYVSAALSQSV